MKKCLYSAYYREDAEYLKNYFKNEWQTEIVYDNISMLNTLKTQHIDFILFDIESAGIFPTEALKKIRKLHPNLHIFIVTHGNSSILREKLLQYEISAFFEFPKEIPQIYNKVKSILINKNNPPDKNKLKQLPIIGESNAVLQLKQFVLDSAKLEYPILLAGETGVGKSMIAKVIHQESSFKTGKFIPVNVSCIPEEIAESILFGAEKGSFTGAEKKEGLFIQADNGTLFLDEIENLSLNIQAKLLNAIETKNIRAVGASKFKKINFRLICATNKDLKELVNKHIFRKDLYYRLDVLRHTIPPLRERKEDISLLINYYLKTKNFTITDTALTKLISYNWPGNVRELFNCLDRCECNPFTKNIIEDFHIEL